MYTLDSPTNSHCYTHTHTHTHNRFTALTDFGQDYPDEPAPEKPGFNGERDSE